MFYGSYEHNLDNKGRLFVPSKFREELGSEVFVTKGLDGCLAIYSKAAFEPKLQEYMALSYNHASTRTHLRINMASFEEVSVDSHGRVAIPTKFLKRENISQEVTIIGVIDHLEIWDRERWNEYYESNYLRDEEIVENIDEGKQGRE